MKLFQLQTDLLRYRYPVIKIIVCIPLIILIASGKLASFFSNPLVNFSVRVVGVVIMVATILCLYISIGELFRTYSNRKNNSCKPVKTDMLSIDTIKGLAERNPQIEIKVQMYDNRIIKLGSSSELKRPKFVLEDKLYYIDKVKYESIEPFLEALLTMFPDGLVPVFRIDGFAVSKIKNLDQY